MVSRLKGIRDWSLSTDEEGHRTYKLKFLVVADISDGPGVIYATPGLPQPGAIWDYGNQVDLWAWCRWDWRITPLVSGEPNRHWEVEIPFATKPPDTRHQRCQDVPIEDPLLEPPKVSGGFSKYTEEATHDRFGRAITNSAWEMFRGPQVEFDNNRPTIRIEQNVAQLEIELFSPMVDTVNSRPLWGFPPRCIKLSNVTWEAKYHRACETYYVRTFEFDINSQTFDRDILDEASKALNGYWGVVSGTGSNTVTGWILRDIDGSPPNRFNPTHFIKMRDREGEPVRIVLNGEGLPAEILTSSSNTFVSIINTNQGELVSNRSAWLEVAMGREDLGILEQLYAQTPVSLDQIRRFVPEWQADRRYNRGEMVLYHIEGAGHITGDDVLFIAMDNLIANRIPTEDEGLFWHRLPQGVTEIQEYSLATVYDENVFVYDTLRTGVGYIHVEKYRESDFLLLGIPTVF